MKYWKVKVEVLKDKNKNLLDALNIKIDKVLNSIELALKKAEDKKQKSTAGAVYSTANIALSASLLFLVPTLALGKVAQNCAYGVGAAACATNAGALVIELSSISKVSGYLSELKEKQRDLMEM
jgi:tRNA A37 threonylcarbamoyladenosine dehydratase